MKYSDCEVLMSGGNAQSASFKVGKSAVFAEKAWWSIT